MLLSMFQILIVLFVYVTIGFAGAVFLKRNDIADVMWGPGIFIAVFTAFIVNDGGPYLTLIIIFLWAARIFVHIGRRFINKKEEDFRYANWRKVWAHFYIRSYFQIFLLQ